MFIHVPAQIGSRESIYPVQFPADTARKKEFLKIEIYRVASSIFSTVISILDGTVVICEGLPVNLHLEHPQQRHYRSMSLLPLDAYWR